jgi:hypothetical protein
MTRLASLVLAALTAGLLVAGCDRPTVLDPAVAPAHRDLIGTTLTGTSSTSTTSTQLVPCPGDSALSASAVIGPGGGLLVAGKFRVEFPAGAVDTARKFVLSVPAGRYVEIDVRADGFDHYWFATPVSVTLDAARCGALPSTVQAWYIDSETKALLEPMGGTYDPTSQTVRFRTSHFSGYSIAW